MAAKTTENGAENKAQEPMKMKYTVTGKLEDPEKEDAPAGNESVDETNNNSVVENIKKVNAILEKGEPDNVSVDTYSGYTGYKPQYIIDAMNAVMLGEWGFEEVSNEFISKGEDGKPTMAMAQVEVWIKDVEFRPKAYGQSRVTKGDFGDAAKGAQTDALKKALSYFSVGNRAFHGKLQGN